MPWPGQASLLSTLKSQSSYEIPPANQYVSARQWNWAAGLLPLWLAPNMVTLIGFFFILANVGLLVLFVPDLVGPVRLPLS